MNTSVVSGKNNPFKSDEKHKEMHLKLFHCEEKNLFCFSTKFQPSLQKDVPEKEHFVCSGEFFIR